MWKNSVEVYVPVKRKEKDYFLLFALESCSLVPPPTLVFLPGWHHGVSGPSWTQPVQHHFTSPRFQAATCGEPRPPLSVHWRRETPITRSQMRVSPYPRALSEMDAPSLPSIGLRSCQSGSLALNTVLLSGSLSAETAVILAARSSSNQGRKEDPHHEEKRVFTAFKT